MHRWLILLAILIVGCRPQIPDDQTQDLRIISLSPALTGMLEDAGLGDAIVGRSSWCVLRTRDQADVPAVGDLHDRNWEAIIRLQPSHVFIQADTIEQDAALLDLSREHGWNPHAWPLKGIGDIKRVLDELPATIISSGPIFDQTLARCRSLAGQLDDSMNPTQIGRGRRILIVNDQTPPLAWGQGTYLDEMLATTGASNAIVRDGWRQLSIEDVVRLKPDLVLVVASESSDERPELSRLVNGSIPDERFHWLTHPRINYPGPHLAEAFHGMRRILSGH